MNTDLLIATYSFIIPRKEEFASEFYAQLFTRSPETYQLFINRQTNMQQQQRLLMKTLNILVFGLRDHLEETIKIISLLGKRHQEYHVSLELYDIVGEVLINTLKTFLKDVWTPEKEASWVEAYALIKLLMIEAYEIQPDR